MTSDLKNKVLQSMASLLQDHKTTLMSINAEDVHQADASDASMYDRLKIDDHKVNGMMQSLRDTIILNDPIGQERYNYTHPNGLKIVNRTAPFGTILIIYESRPDVTIEAAALAFKAGNSILLKGGKEARQSNLFLVDLWHRALQQHGVDQNVIQYLDYTREQTTELLKSGKGIDLVVPRGGEALIKMVKSYSSAPVLVSGRGNNFIYIHEYADLSITTEILINSKLHKISVCNATDKILFDRHLPNVDQYIEMVRDLFQSKDCEVLIDPSITQVYPDIEASTAITEQTYYEEFLARKVMLVLTDDVYSAIKTINTYSGGHTAVILTQDQQVAAEFMDRIDAASVIHNASSRFTDGGQFGLGAELAISTDKLHHRGPLGLDHLVTNKWYVYGNGQIR